MEQFSSARHHLGFYNNVGISAQYKLQLPRPLDSRDVHDLVFGAVTNVIQKHPILSAIPIDEDTPNPYFARLSVIDLVRAVTFVTRVKTNLSGGDEELDALLQWEHNTNFKAGHLGLPFWRLVILQNPEVLTEFTACFIFHHSLGDGASGLVFHKSFLAALNNPEVTSTSEPPRTIVQTPNIPLLPCLESMHPLPIPGSIGKTTATVFEEWKGQNIRLPCETRFRHISIDANKSKAFLKACKDSNSSVTSALPALIASTLFTLVPPSTEALSCVIPVSLRRWLLTETTTNAMGVWIDAFQVQFPRPTSKRASVIDWQQAQICQNAIKAYLSHGGNAINVARFKNIPDMASIFASKIGQARDSAFEVSNLGVFDALKTDGGWDVGKIVFSRSAFASGSAIAVSVVSGSDGALSLGFTWQEGVVEEEVVDRLINELENTFTEGCI